uniref:Uncharacterized protein n=1 Tax=Seriola lalandi dorsalis TaxID=1841481 RepID=A0A3B4XZ41_SERLL
MFGTTYLTTQATVAVANCTLALQLQCVCLERKRSSVCQLLSMGDGNIVVWGCMAVSDTGNTAQIVRRMDSTKYQDIQSACVLRFDAAIFDANHSHQALKVLAV